MLETIFEHSFFSCYIYAAMGMVDGMMKAMNKATGGV